MKISIITAVYNGGIYLDGCIQSVLSQAYPDIEYIIVDGGSTDETLSIIEKYRSKIQHVISEKDFGLYDAINKGISLASGDVIGILNADDLFADTEVVKNLAEAFVLYPSIQGLYGDLNYINLKGDRIVRRWQSKSTTYKDLELGWMPAHPTFYLKKELFKQYGLYALDMGTAADYDLILRYLYMYRIKTFYMPLLMVKMRVGGVSNRSIKARLLALKNDYKALKRNRVPKPFYVLMKKKLSKLVQFITL